MSLIDVHAHFLTERSGRADWDSVNARRLSAGLQMGITTHVASILGSWGHRSPTYFPSQDDITHANDAMLAMQRAHAGHVFGYCVVNPNYPTHALAEITRCTAAGMIGVKLAASRRADDTLLDEIAAACDGLPVLHHVWHWRRRDWPGQEVSDGAELGRLAARHPKVNFIVAHLGGGGDWMHTLRVAREVPNLWADLSGSGVDWDMMDRLVTWLGAGRLLFGTDLTMGTGWGKLRYLEARLSADELELVRAGNARRIFQRGTFS